MHTLFNNPRMFNLGAQNLPGWNNAREALYKELNKLARYFRESSEWVLNTHPLVKLLKSDNTPLYQNADTTLEVARNRWLEDAELFGISTPYRRMTNVPNNIAYPNNINEYLVMDDSIPLGNEIKYNWKLLEPIKVLDHPYCDLNLGIPNSRYTGENVFGNKTYICINIPVLILQYRLWQHYEAERNGIDPESPHMFLSRYPLFNIVNSHMDIVLRNRFIQHYNQVEPTAFKSLRVGGVAVNNTSHYVDRALLHAVKIISSGSFTFNEINQQIPQLSMGNVAQTLILPEMTYTRSVRWVYDASRLSWLNFLAQYQNDHGNEKNRQDIEFMKRRIKTLRNDREFYDNIGIGVDTTYGKLSSLLQV